MPNKYHMDFCLFKPDLVGPQISAKKLTLRRLDRLGVYKIEYWRYEEPWLSGKPVFFLQDCRQLSNEKNLVGYGI